MEALGVAWECSLHYATPTCTHGATSDVACFGHFGTLVDPLHSGPNGIQSVTFVCMHALVILAVFWGVESDCLLCECAGGASHTGACCRMLPPHLVEHDVWGHDFHAVFWGG